MSKDAAPEIPPFLLKTYAMLEDTDNREFISWIDDTTISVRNPQDLAKNVLPKYFKHSNFCSFVRQLNTYGFKKIEVNPSAWEFKHEEEKFRRGEKQLLSEIKRKTTTKRNVDNTLAGGEGEDLQPTVHFLGNPEVVQTSKKKSQKVQGEEIEQRDFLVNQVSLLQHQHQQTMAVLMTLVNEIKDTKQKVKDIQKKYNEINHKLNVPAPATNGYEYVLIKKERQPEEPLPLQLALPSTEPKDNHSANNAPLLQISQDDGLSLSNSVLNNPTSPSESYPNLFSPDFSFPSLPSSPLPLQHPTTTTTTTTTTTNSIKPQMLAIPSTVTTTSVSSPQGGIFYSTRPLGIEIGETDSLFQDLNNHQAALEQLMYGSDSANALYYDPPDSLEMLKDSSHFPDEKELLFSSNIESLADELKNLNRHDT